MDPALRGCAAEVYARSFFDYPAMVASWPDPGRRKRYLAWYLGCAIQYGLLYGEVYITLELAGLAAPTGLAIWLPPGQTTISAWQAVRAGFLRTPLRMGLRQFWRERKLEDPLQAAHAGIMGQRPHWYLWGLAVEPARQGQGIGGRLLREGLKKVDAQGMPCYLETHVEKNVRFYAQEGFKMVRGAATADATLHFWCMLREAHGGGAGLSPQRTQNPQS